MKKLGFRRMFDPHQAEFSRLQSSSSHRHRNQSKRRAADNIDDDYLDEEDGEEDDELQKLGRGDENEDDDDVQKSSSQQNLQVETGNKIAVENSVLVVQQHENESRFDKKTSETRQSLLETIKNRTEDDKESLQNDGSYKMSSEETKSRGKKSQKRNNTKVNTSHNSGAKRDGKSKGSKRRQNTRNLVRSKFTVMSPYVSQMMHKAIIDVNENGMAASAVTASRMTSRVFVPTVRVDHPFMFVLRDKKLGINLFIGRVVDPR
jgi:hypothetical protein